MQSTSSSLDSSSQKPKVIKFPSIVRTASLTALFVHPGKTLEQMAEVFGDEVDAHDVLKSSAAHEKLDHEKLDGAKA